MSIPSSKKLEAFQKGRQAEEVAAAYLLGNGYVIRERNWKNSKGKNEIDIIAQKGNTIVFVEVKERSSSGEDAVSAVNNRKMVKMTRAADSYMGALSQHLFYRFDIIAFQGEPIPDNLSHYPDAFISPISLFP